MKEGLKLYKCMSLNNRLEELNQDLIKANSELQEFLKKLDLKSSS